LVRTEGKEKARRGQKMVEDVFESVPLMQLKAKSPHCLAAPGLLLNPVFSIEIATPGGEF